MRWFVLTLFIVLSAYLLDAAYFNAWVSITPDPGAYKTRIYVLIAGAFVTLALGVNVFLLIGKKDKMDRMAKKVLAP